MHLIVGFQRFEQSQIADAGADCHGDPRFQSLSSDNPVPKAGMLPIELDDDFADRAARNVQNGPLSSQSTQCRGKMNTGHREEPNLEQAASV